MGNDEYVLNILKNTDESGRLKRRERNDLEFKESFSVNSFAKYAKIMASFANNIGGYIIFGIKDNPREIKGVNNSFLAFEQERFTECLNCMFAPEIIWNCGVVEHNNMKIGYIYTAIGIDKPVVAQKNDSGEKINSGDVFYRYRARSEKIKYSEMRHIIDENRKKEQERILKLIEDIRKSGATNIGIVNYTNGHLTTPYGVDVEIDKKLVVQVLKKAKYIKAGEFDEKNGTPVLKITGDISLAEEVQVPDIEPDVKYPYFQKDLQEKLKLKQTEVRALLWKYQMRGPKKFHQESTTARNGQKMHKYSDIALDFLAEEINKHKTESDWLGNIVIAYNQSDKEIK